jgi:hypothetical protein
MVAFDGVFWCQCTASPCPTSLVVMAVTVALDGVLRAQRTLVVQRQMAVAITEKSTLTVEIIPTGHIPPHNFFSACTN